VRPRTTPSVRPPLGGGLRKSELWPQMLPFLLPLSVISCSIPVFLRHVGSHPRHQLIKSICSIIVRIKLMPQYLCGTEQIKVVSGSRVRNVNGHLLNPWASAQTCVQFPLSSWQSSSSCPGVPSSLSVPQTHPSSFVQQGTQDDTWHRSTVWHGSTHLQL
jgi:hypothetical protein